MVDDRENKTAVTPSAIRREVVDLDGQSVRVVYTTNGSQVNIVDAYREVVRPPQQAESRQTANIDQKKDEVKTQPINAPVQVELSSGEKDRLQQKLEQRVEVEQKGKDVGFTQDGYTRIKGALYEVRSQDVRPENQTVAYSGPERGHGGQDTTNRQRAEKYAEREGATTLEQGTARGSGLESKQGEIRSDALNAMGNERSANALVYREWKNTSHDYADQAHGEVKAYGAGASPDRVFRSVEFPTMIDNPKIQSINGVPRTKLQEVAQISGIDRAYYGVTVAGIRQDLHQGICFHIKM